jgi:hypothetical protein
MMHSFTQDLVLGGNFNIINNRNTLLFLRIEALSIPTQLKLPGLKGGACVGDMLVRKLTGSCLKIHQGVQKTRGHPILLLSREKVRENKTF